MADPRPLGRARPGRLRSAQTPVWIGLCVGAAALAGCALVERGPQLPSRPTADQETKLALERTAAALEKNPDDIGALEEACDVYRTFSSLYATLATCGRLAELKPDDIDAHRGLATAYHGLRAHAQAETAALAVLERDANDQEAATILAAAWIDQGRDREAAPLLERLAAERPDDPRTHASLARTYAKLGRGAEARLLLAEFTNRHPDDRETGELLAGLSAAAQRRLGGARARVAASPDDAAALYQLGLAEGAEGSAPAALDALDRALAALPATADAGSRQRALAARVHYARALILERVGRDGEALDALQFAIATDQELRWSSWQAMRRIYRNLGDADGAALVEGLFERARAESPVTQRESAPRRD